MEPLHKFKDALMFYLIHTNIQGSKTMSEILYIRIYPYIRRCTILHVFNRFSLASLVSCFSIRIIYSWCFLAASESKKGCIKSIVRRRECLLTFRRFPSKNYPEVTISVTILCHFFIAIRALAVNSTWCIDMSSILITKSSYLPLCSRVFIIFVECSMHSTNTCLNLERIKQLM